MKIWLRQMGIQALLMVATVVSLYPVLWVVKLALSPSQNFVSPSASPLPTELTLANFEHVLTVKDANGQVLFALQAFNSFVIALATTVVGLGLSSSAAYAFSRFRFPGRQAGLAAFMLTQIFPGVVMTVPLYILLDVFHLLNSRIGLVLVYSTTAIPFCTWMLKGYFDTIPREMEDAALIEGASRFTIFWRVVLPLARPALAVTALFSFMTAWNEYILAATFMNNESMFTLPVALQRFVGQRSTEWGNFAAGALLTSSVVMAIFFVLQKHLVGGLTAGSVKG